MKNKKIHMPSIKPPRFASRGIAGILIAAAFIFWVLPFGRSFMGSLGAGGEQKGDELRVEFTTVGVYPENTVRSGDVRNGIVAGKWKVTASENQRSGTQFEITDIGFDLANAGSNTPGVRIAGYRADIETVGSEGATIVVSTTLDSSHFDGICDTVPLMDPIVLDADESELQLTISNTRYTGGTVRPVLCVKGKSSIIAEGYAVAIVPAVVNASVAAPSAYIHNYINFFNEIISPYAGVNSPADATSIEDSGATLHLSDRNFEMLSYAYDITPATIIEFDFKSASEGLYHAIGIDTDDNWAPRVYFAMYGTEFWHGIHDYHDYQNTAKGWRRYRIPIGRTYQGSMNFLTFLNNPGGDATADSYFRNVRLYESSAPPGMVDFSLSPPLSYAEVATPGAEPLIEDNGATLHLTARNYQMVRYRYAVTSQTIMEFDYQSDAEGLFQGIGIDTDDNWAPLHYFVLHGSQLSNGDHAFHTYSENAPGWQKYRIPLGDFYEGDMAFLTFLNSPDSDAPAESRFRNVRLYESAE